VYVIISYPGGPYIAVAVPSYVIFITLHVSLVVGMHAGALGFTGLCVR